MNKITIPACAAAVFMLGATPAFSADAKDNWTKNCASCHGPDGAGHTKAGRMAQVKNMTDPKYQATFTDEQAAKQIKEGLKDPTGKEKMKAFGDLFSDADIKALVDYIRTLQAK
jgi:mono/diheme cytochrome c family protein